MSMNFMVQTQSLKKYITEKKLKKESIDIDIFQLATKESMAIDATIHVDIVETKTNATTQTDHV